MNYFNNINLNQNELQKAVMHPLANPPADPKQGQMYFNTGNKKLYYYDSTKWVALTGVVALESTYSLTLDGTSGTLQQTEYDNLSGDDASYIWHTQTGVQPIRLTKVMSGEGSLQYQAVVSDIVMAVIIQSDKTWEFAQFNVEDAANKKTAIAGSGNDTDYPTTKAVADYVGDNSAPKDHATTATTYGVGTTQKYGHVKLVTGDMNGKANADGQVPSLNHTHSQYALLSGATFTGNVTIGGDLTVNGTTTTIESTTLAVKDKLIEVASGNTEKLTSPAGLVVPKYDGTNSGALVFDGDGIAYVGDVVLNANGDIDVAQSDLQALAARAKNIVNGNIVKWDNATQTFIDTGIAASNLATVNDIPTNYVTTDTAQTISGVKTFTGNVILSSTLEAGTSVGTPGQVLTSQGNGKAPQWTTLSLLQGTVRKLAWSIVGDGTTTMFENNNTLATAECTASVYLQVSGATWELVMTDVIVTAAKIQIKFAQAPTNGQSFRVVVTG